MLAYSRCYFGAIEKERKELVVIQRGWKTLHISNPNKERRHGKCSLKEAYCTLWVRCFEGREFVTARFTMTIMGRNHSGLGQVVGVGLQPLVYNQLGKWGLGPWPTFLLITLVMLMSFSFILVCWPLAHELLKGVCQYMYWNVPVVMACRNLIKVIFLSHSSISSCSFFQRCSP